MFIPSYLVNEQFDDRYFDVVDALDEAQQIYFQNNDLTARIKTSLESGKPLVIGETGFGAGRIVVSLMEFLHKSGFENISIEYYSVELYPLSYERMHTILQGFENRVGNEINILLDEYKNIDKEVPGWHAMKLQQPFGKIELKLWIGEALEMVDALEKSCDVWFLDGHGPKKNPSIWRPELLMAIGKRTNIGGACSTFTVASSVKNALTSAGFILTKLPGCGGKKSVLQGIRQNNIN